MEREVVERGLLGTRSVAASLGGGNDTGRGLSPKGRQLLREAIERNGVPLLTAAQLDESIRERVKLYKESCAPRPIAAYINVGGGVASLGHSLNGDLVPSGASERLPMRNYPTRGAMMRIAADGVPIIHLLNIRGLRDRYGLDPVLEQVPVPGTGNVFGEIRYNLVQTFLVTAVITTVLVGLFLFDRRIHRLGQPGPEAGEL